MLAAALKDNHVLKELYLGDNKLQPVDGQSLCSIIKENKCLDVLDLKNNSLLDAGLSHMCSGLSELARADSGLKALVLAGNGLTATGVSYLAKALLHNRSLVSLNVSQNALTNEAVYELKDALIVNKQISCLFLAKTRLTDEGAVALAEYVAETGALRRLDLRENDIRLGGLMALASALKFNGTLARLDLDREPKRESSVRDSGETARRLLKDIADFCMRNKRSEQLERDARIRRQEEEEEEDRKRRESIVVVNVAHKTGEVAELESKSKEDGKEKEDEDDECVDVVKEEDELLRKILARETPSLFSPVKPNDEDLMSYFKLVDKNYDEKLSRSCGLSIQASGDTEQG